MDRFEFSLQLADSVPHFPALDLVKGLADPSPAATPTLSLFGPLHALAGREVLEPCQLHLKLRFLGRDAAVGDCSFCVSVPVVCSRPSANCRVPLEWKHTRVLLAWLANHSILTFPSSSMGGAIELAG